MCKYLKVSKSAIYYKNKHNIKADNEAKIEKEIINAFLQSNSNYGTRKLKVKLRKINIIASRHKIRQVMIKNYLISNYAKSKYKPTLDCTNADNHANHLNQNFNDKKLGEVIVSDLTYVRVKNKWNYVCLVIDLCNREVIAQSVGEHKTASLVNEALLSSNRPLNETKFFHTDRGSEFKNQKIAETLSFFGIKRSLSKKGCPYDNAVAEATYKILKTELINNQKFESLSDLKNKVFDYINWYNNFRIHGSLGYLTPVEYRKIMSIKKVS